MMIKNQKDSPRRELALVSVVGTTQLHLRSPYVVAWWSAAFPGLGHILLSKFIRGFFLFLCEIIVNTKANINLAILYSFTGKFELAKSVLDKRWLLIYCPMYIFAIWDSYRATIDINNNYILAAREDAKVKPFKLTALELNYLDKRTPWISALWSLMMPGAGQLYIHRIATATFTFIWWIIIVYYSRTLPAIHYSFIGCFEQARHVVNPHWLLNVSSVYLFSMYDAYVNTVENNKLFEWEQSKFFRDDYQSAGFKIPTGSNIRGGEKMYLIATFEHSIHLEKAITAIQMKGIAKKEILAVPMDKRAEKVKLFDTIHRSDGLSLVDLAATLGTVFMLLGTIYGFLLKWGPILWGLIGLAAGFAVGLTVKLIAARKYSGRQEGKKATEVVLIIECNEDRIDMVRDTFWEHHALGVSKLSLDGNEM